MRQFWQDVSTNVTIMPIGLLACLLAFLVSLRPVLLATAHMPYYGSARGKTPFHDTLLHY